MRRRIDAAIERYLSTGHGDIRPLVNSPLGDYRLRVGRYRVLFDIEGSTMIVQAVRIRGGAYGS